MLRLRKDQPSLWESILPEALLQLPEELARVDALVDDERFFALFRERFACDRGRPT
ncbi:MAG: ISNCY family transposase, partial [Chloroflexi bacterium]|nr:ISNCY family transposase [Chloroflexota bacterium]